MLALLRRSNVLSRQLLDANLSLIRSLGNAIAKRDADTDGCNEHVSARDAAVLVKWRRSVKRMIDDLADFPVNVGWCERVIIMLALEAVPGFREPLCRSERYDIQS